MSRIPVSILTGFLGSGKTTRLEALLRLEAFRGVGVVVNEASFVDVDRRLLADVDAEVVLLEGGCLCCRPRGALGEGLLSLLRASESAGRELNRVIVETSGLADPTPLLVGLMTHSALTRRFSIAGITCLVDAVNGAATLARHPESAAQVALADRVILTKIDLATPAALAATRAAVAAIDPASGGGEAPRGPLDAACIWPDPREGRRLPVRRFAAAAAPHGFAHAGLVFPGRLGRIDVDAWLDRLDELFGDRLLRMKGILHVAEASAPVVLNGVQGLVHSPGLLGGETGAHGDNHMVLIARDVETLPLEDALRHLANLSALDP